LPIARALTMQLETFNGGQNGFHYLD